MATRFELHEGLKNLLKNGQVFFQPLPTVKLSYPCIVYSRGTGRFFRADNRIYAAFKRYTLIYITRNPDDEIIDEIVKMERCRSVRSYVADNLYHYVYEIYI